MFHSALLKKTFQLCDHLNHLNFLFPIEGFVTQNQAKIWRDKYIEWKTASQMYFFRILSQKNARIMNLKNPDLDLI